MTLPLMSWIGVLCASGIALSGCTAVQPADDMVAPWFSDSSATLSGRIQSVEALPVPGARVLLGPMGLERITAEDGRFVFEVLEGGEYGIRVEAAGFQPAWLNRSIGAGENTEVTILLQPAAGLEPYHVTHFERGFFECSILVIGVSAPCALGTNDRSDFVFEHGAELFSIVNELSWRKSVFGAGDRLTVAGFPNATGAAVSFCTATGGSPVVADWRRDQGCLSPEWAKKRHESEVSNGSSAVRAMVWTGPSATTPYVGLTYGQAFDLWASFFYRGPPPDGFSALQEG